MRSLELDRGAFGAVPCARWWFIKWWSETACVPSYMRVVNIIAVWKYRISDPCHSYRIGSSCPG